MSIQKLDSDVVRAQWREWVAAAGAGKRDVVVVVEGKETAALISYTDYLALRDELIKLRADRKPALEAMAADAALDYLRLDEQMGDDDPGGDDGGDG